jgi:adenine-specific DNA-methyltransferase
VKVFYLGEQVFAGKNVSTCILVVDKARQGIELHEIRDSWRIVTCYEKDHYDAEIIRFDSPKTRAFEEDTVPLGSLFDIHFAARSPEVKKHPLVSKEPKPGSVPILTGRNLHPGRIDYERCYSHLWIPREAAPSLRSFYAVPHLVVGHTKGGRVVAAVDRECYPWREDIHLIPNSDGIDIDAIENYLNSQGVQEYMGELYKRITPHLTITQLKQLPIPSDFLPKTRLP